MKNIKDRIVNWFKQLKKPDLLAALRIGQFKADRRVLLGGALVAVLIIGAVLFTNRRYSNYRVVTDSVVSKTDNVSDYLSVGNLILRYSGEGASLLNHSLDSRWNVTYEMNQPRVDTCGKTILIYEYNGTAVRVFNSDGEIISYQTPSPIVKACVSEKGNVAILLTDAESTVLKYYSADGSDIAVISPSMEKNGYPVDFDVSSDGAYLAVSYMTPTGNSVDTALTFYAFGADGQGVADNIIKTEIFSDVISPVVRYGDGNELALIRENGFTLFSGRNPSVVKSVDFEEDIISTFFCEDRIGFVFENDRERSDEPYVLKLYDRKGNSKANVRIPVYYDEIQPSGDQIIFIGSSDMTIVDHNGKIRFDGALSEDEGEINSVTRTGVRKYLVVANKKTETIVLQ